MRFSLESVAHNPVVEQELVERVVNESDEKLCVPIISTSPKIWNKEQPPQSFMVPGKIRTSKFVLPVDVLFVKRFKI